MSLKLTVHIIVGFGIIALAGCGTVSYYAQAIGGQWSLLREREPISGLLDSSATPAVLRGQLAKVQTIRDFADETLALPVGETYSGYVDLQRNYVVWNVLAAPADSLELKAWCYPVVGCQNYRGYFDRAQAQALARELAADGWDTWAPGIVAYSSLGWFDDPLLNTFAFWPEDQLAALIFHELSHKTVYIGGDTTFNESYATAVELEGLRRYLRQQGQAGDFAGALGRQRMEREFTTLVMAIARRLQDLYAQSGLSTATVLNRKAELIADLRVQYERQRRDWPDSNAYSGFFGPGLNNARIASVGTYNRWVPAFRQLLREEEGNFARFHEAVRKLAALPEAERERQLQALESRFIEFNSPKHSNS
jgi:predicted aminopeptidase